MFGRHHDMVGTGYLTLVTGYRVQPRPRMPPAFWSHGGHGGGKPEAIENTNRRAFEFVKLHLERC